MVRWIALLFACALGLAAPALAQQRQQVQQRTAPTLQQRAADTSTSQAVLPANAAWTPTRVEVRAGAGLQISAQGRWSAVTPSRTAAAAPRDTSTDANGYADTPAGRGAPLPEANRGALIGRIGDNGAPFLIGAAYRGRASADGMLFVTMNEPAEALQDNQGRMAISITTTPPPPPRQPDRTQEQPQPQPTPADPPRPVDPTTGAPTPNDPPAPADPPTAQTPNDGAAPTPQPEQTPQAQPTPTPTPAPDVVEPPAPIMSDGVRYTLIGLGVLAALLIVSLMIRPRGARGGERGDQGAGAQVSARIVSDGIAGQSLTIRTGGR